MKRLIVVILLILSTNTAFAQPPSLRENADLLKLWRDLAAFHPRHEAGPYEVRTRTYIRAFLDDHGIPYQEHGFEDFEGAHSFSRVIEATIPGQREDRLVLAVPLNHQYGAPPDQNGSISIAAALALAADAAAETLPVTVTVLFLGAECEPLPGYPLGSRLYVSQYSADRPTAVVYLDLKRPVDRVVLETATEGIVTPSWLLQSVAQVLRGTALDFDSQAIHSQIQRIGSGEYTPRIAPYLAAGIPAIGIRGGETADKDQFDMTVQPVEELVGAILELTHLLGTGIPTQWDRHYVFFQLGASLLVLSERLYLLILLGLIVATLFYAVAFRHRFERYAHTVIRNFWSVPAIYLILFVLLLLATAVLESFLDYRAYTALWRHQPLAYFSMKLAIAVFLFAIGMLPLRRTLLASTSSFYSATALVVLFAGIVTLAVVNISFSYYFLWAFFWAFLFAVLPTRLLKTASLLIAPAPLLHSAYVVFQSGEFATARVFLLSPINGNLLTALIVLPFLLMVLRLDFLVRHPRVGRRSFVLQTVATVAAFSILALGMVLAQYTPYGEDNPQPVSLHEQVDLVNGTRTISLRGTGAPIGAVPLRIGSDRRIWTGEPLELTAAHVNATPALNTVTRRASFLERNRIQTSVTADTDIYTATVTIHSEIPLLIYDANLPLALTPDGYRASVFVGALPPNPFLVDITVSEGVRGKMIIQTTSRSLTEEVTIERPDLRLDSTRRTVRTIVDL